MGQVAIALHHRADAVRDIGPRGVITLAKAAKQIGREEAQRVTGGDGKLTGHKRRGVALRVFDKIDKGDRVTFLAIKGRPAGPWVWVTDGTRAHTIRRRRKGPLRKLTVPHPGTSGAGVWREARRRMIVVVPEVFRAELHAAVARR